MFYQNKLKYINKAASIGCFILLLFSACCKVIEQPPVTEVRTEDGVLTSKEFIWKKDVSEKGLIWGTVSPAIYENTVVVAGATNQERDMLVALNLDSGEEVWRWTDYFTIEHISAMSNSEYEFNQKDNIWLLQNSYNFYAIDLKTGTTLWKDKRNVGIGGIEGMQIIGNKYYTSFAFYKNDSLTWPTLVEGDIYSTNYSKILEAPIDSIQFFGFFYGNMDEPFMYEENGQLYAFLQFSENVDVYTSKIFNYVASYNLTNQSYDFEKTRLGDTATLGLGHRAVMYNDLMLVNADQELYGINKYTGEVVWHLDQFDKNGDGVFTYAIYKDKLIAVNKIGVTSRVMALNPLTGQIIWEDIGRGNAAESIHFLNDVLYFSSRGDGHVYAYDTENGELLWQLDSPEYESFQGYGGLRAIPGKNGEKGKIIASTYTSAFCYEAER